MNTLFNIDEFISFNIFNEFNPKEIGRVCLVCQDWRKGMNKTSKIIEQVKGSVLTQFITSFSMLLQVNNFQDIAERFNFVFSFKIKDESNPNLPIYQFSYQDELAHPSSPISIFVCIQRVAAVSATILKANPELLTLSDCQVLMIQSFGQDFYNHLIHEVTTDKNHNNSPTKNNLEETEEALIQCIYSLIDDKNLDTAMSLTENIPDSKIRVIQKFLSCQHVEEGLTLIDQISNKQQKELIYCCYDFLKIEDQKIEDWFKKEKQERCIQLLANILEIVDSICGNLFLDLITKMGKIKYLILAKFIQKSLEKQQIDKITTMIDFFSARDLSIYASITKKELIDHFIENANFPKAFSYIQNFDLLEKLQPWFNKFLNTYGLAMTTDYVTHLRLTLINERHQIEFEKAQNALEEILDKELKAIQEFQASSGTQQEIQEPSPLQAPSIVPSNDQIKMDRNTLFTTFLEKAISEKNVALIREAQCHIYEQWKEDPKRSLGFADCVVAFIKVGSPFFYISHSLNNFHIKDDNGLKIILETFLNHERWPDVAEFTKNYVRNPMLIQVFLDYIKNQFLAKNYTKIKALLNAGLPKDCQEGCSEFLHQLELSWGRG